MSDRLSALQAKLEAMRSPNVVATVSRSIRERSEDLTRDAFCAAFIAIGMPENALADRLGVCTRMVRDWRSGARAVPAWVFAALPRDGQIAAYEVLAGAVPSRDEDWDRGAA